jgi:hypothetical protein
MRGLAAYVVARKRRVEIEAAFRVSPATAILRATDFLTGSSAPSFARAAGPNRAVLIDMAQELARPTEPLRSAPKRSQRP